MKGQIEGNNYISKEIIEEFYKCTFENSLNAIVFLDNENKIIHVNKSFEKLFQYDYKEIKGLNIIDIIVPQDYLDEANEFTERLTEKRISEIETLRKCKNGKFINVNITSYPVIYEGRTVGKYIIYVDITERKRIEDELKLQKSYSKQLFENSPEAMAILDNRDRVIEINDGFQNLFQYSLEEAKGHYVNDLIVAKEFLNEAEFLTNKVINGGIVKRQTKRKSKDGRLIDVEALAYPIVHDGKQIGIFTVYINITEAKRREGRINYLAYRDSLTGLYNRAKFYEALDIMLNKPRQDDKKLEVIYIDLDNFKKINDNFGHYFGDKVLKEFAKRLKQVVPKESFIARIGGDEFTVLLNNELETYDSAIISKKIIETLKQPIIIDEHRIYISPSIGISTYPQNGLNSDKLIRNADIAMYKAKEDGGNRYELYSCKLDERLKDEYIIETSLRTALDKKEFSLHYQPIKDMRVDRIVGAEALIRWKHPFLGYISPNRFIPIAEDSGLIITIGEWVLRTACRQNKEWQDLGYPHIFIAVNISIKQLEDESFVDLVSDILEKTGLDPKYLELEITESISRDNIKDRMNTLKKLQSLGVRLSIDDFGTGYSSLGQLKDFAISTLKIDKSFIEDITANLDNAAITSAIIAMAKSLNLKVIAEGVETKNQLYFLKKRHCDMIQGYLLGKPVSSKSFIDFLKE